MRFVIGFVLVVVLAVIGYMLVFSQKGSEDVAPDARPEISEAPPMPAAAEAAAEPSAPAETSAAETAAAPLPSDLPGVGVGAPSVAGYDPMRDEGLQMYRRGLYPEALEQWRKQYAAGDAVAAYRLGVEYHDGKTGVVERDYGVARDWFEKAMAGGVPDAFFDMGAMHEWGLGVEKSLERAAELYGEAARRGHAQGQYNYATFHETGEAGVARDPVEAYKWYLLASRQGFTGVALREDGTPDSRQPLPMELLARQLSQDQIAEATARADAFAPQR